MVTSSHALSGQRLRQEWTAAFAMRNRRWIVFASEIATIGVSLAAAFLLRFEFDIPPREQALLLPSLGLALLVKFAAFRMAALERRSFRYVSLADVAPIAAANLGGSIVFALTALVIIGPQFPRSVFLIDLMLCFTGIVLPRLALRWWWESRPAGGSESTARKRILIYGAGTAGVTLLRRIRTDADAGASVAAFIDDDPVKRDSLIQGVPVAGGGADLGRAIQCYRADEIWIAAPSAPRHLRERITERCRQTGLRFHHAPTVAEMVIGSRPLRSASEISSRDLIGRELVELGARQLERWISRQRIMITGAAGSIGSELCRQAAACRPQALIAVDRSEGGLFEIELRSREASPDVSLTAELADINDAPRMAHLIARHRPSVIYHAAAYKHVPLMEQHISQAVENNVIAVRSLLQAADEMGVERFVLISSDKAVRPASVMGATKRLAELAACSFAAVRTRAMAVRFGNVLGSSGSLLPILQRQIAGGGPVTVTHPEMTRYFMDLSEAVSLVMHASYMGSGGEIFVLDMGEPVRIVDLAERLIRLSGYMPYRDIDIVFTEPRPGEKLHEELAFCSERLKPSANRRIRVVEDGVLSPLEEARMFRELERCVSARDECGLLAAMERIVPEYTPSDIVRGSVQRRDAAARPANT